MGLAARIAHFLCRDEQEQRWMLDMHERLLPATRVAGLLGVVGALAIVPWTNPLALVPILLASIGMAATIGMASARGDVRPIFPAVVFLQISIATAILINGRAGVGDMFLLVTSIVPCAGGFPGRVVTALAIFCGTLMTAVAFVSGAVLASPPILILPLLMLASVTLLSTAIRRASIEHLQISTVDALTGALTRMSLDMRNAELAQQTAVTGEPVALVVVDVDDFKLVNDLFGHQAGDRVLIALAGLLRSHGPAFRLGGDEFVVLLPGLTATEAAVIAEAIAATVRSAPLADVPVTVSVGVAASVAGVPFAFAEVFEGADSALYSAKRGGRDAVRIASSGLAIA